MKASVRSAISDQTVSAYVDGELPPHEAAALLRRMAGDHELADRVAALTQLKSEMRDLPVPGGLDTDALMAASSRAAGAGRRRRRWRMAAIAASVVALALMAGLWAALPRPAAIAEGGDGLIRAAVSQHLKWMEGPASGSPVEAFTGPRTSLAAFAREYGNVYVPDLGATKLHLVRSAPFGKDGVQVRYVGVHDCRLSLFIIPDPAARPSPLRKIAHPDARVFAWRANRLDYLLVAAGMDPARLDLISRAVFEATNNLQPFNATTQVALDLNHRQSRPCATG